jgi:hypothetical protein
VRLVLALPAALHRARPPGEFGVPAHSRPHSFGIWGKPQPTPCPHRFSTGMPMRPVYFFVDNFGRGGGPKSGRLFLLHTRWIAFTQINASCPLRDGRLSTA